VQRVRHDGQTGARSTRVAKNYEVLGYDKDGRKVFHAVVEGEPYRRQALRDRASPAHSRRRRRCDERPKPRLVFCAIGSSSSCATIDEGGPARRRARRSRATCASACCFTAAARARTRAGACRCHRPS